MQLKILVVDDDLPIRKMLFTLFGKLGHEIVGAESGEEAVELLSKNNLS